MKLTLTLIKRAALLMLLSTLNYQPSTFAQGTSFTYQGRLNDGSSPATGNYDLTFTLFGVSSGGSALAGPLTNAAMSVSNGLFTVTLDFGADVFTGEARWLEIGVRTNGGGAFSPLSPRQPVTPSPYAIHAGSMQATGLTGTIPANALAGTYDNAVNFTNAGNSFTGDGTALTNVNAATLGGLNSSNFWQLGGNAGTTPGPQFLGSTDNQPVEIKVNGLRALRLEPGGTNAPNLLAGAANNVVTPGVVGAVIAGGGGNSVTSGVVLTNRVTDAHGVVGGGLGNVAGNDNPDLADARYATVGGGVLNTSSGFGATVGGGYQNNNSGYGATLGGGFQNTNSGYEATLGGGFQNSNSGSYATLGGGRQNTSSSDYATLGGGYQNTSSSDYATLGGGYQNTNSGVYATLGGGYQNLSSGLAATLGGGYLNTGSGIAATVPGGYLNLASGDYSFAAGYQAQATNAGAFVWADSTGGDFTSTANDQFLIRASGGVGINTANPVADLHVNGPIVIQGTAFTPGLSSSTNLLNLMVGGGSSPVATNGSRNGISFYEGAASKAMSIGYDGSSSAGSNALRIYHSSDASLFTFEDSGQLGIGTPTPTTALHVKDAAGDVEISVESSDAGGHRWTMQSSGVTGSANLDASFQIIDRTAGGSRFFIGTNGNVGVRTTTPATALAVNGTVTATAFSGSVSPTNLAAGTVSTAVSFTNAANQFTGAFAGNGGGLANLDASQLASGTVPDARLSNNLARTNQVWLLGGNGGTTAGTHFLGTTDNQALELKVNGSRALRLQPGFSGSVNVIGGFVDNYVNPAASGATIGGGGALGQSNAVFGSFATIAGGTDNNIGTNCDYSAIGGGYDNNIAANSFYATIAGGDVNDIGTNSGYGAIGGGFLNKIAGGTIIATIAGGFVNDIGTSSDYSFIGGGNNNNIAANSAYATIAGGIGNDIGTNSAYSTIGGGNNNTIAPNSLSATIPGGINNTATNYAFAAGRRAQAMHQGTFVWADSTDTNFTSSANDQFLIRASGGVGINVTNPVDSLHVQSDGSLRVRTTTTGTGFAGFLSKNSLGEWFAGVANGTNHWYVFENAPSSGARLVVKSGGNVGIGTIAPTNKLHVIGGATFSSGAGGTDQNVVWTPGSASWSFTSDRNAKDRITPVDRREVLEKLSRIPMAEWSYRGYDQRHIGPMAQDFHAQFPLNADATSLNDADLHGVALAAIQGLNEKVEVRSQRSEDRSRKLEERLQQKETEISSLKRELDQLKQIVDNLANLKANQP